MSNSIPTGTVTFLFTDIEGSTAMWENHPLQMKSALTRHDEILRSTIESHDGYIFKMVGDACCAAFGSARQALVAALVAQRALFAEEWDEKCRPKVRMALHTGVPEERRGDYFGPPVNRVARLLSAGHGGQTLLSGVTYGLVRDGLSHLEPNAELRDMGEHRLRDLRYTEHIHQLVVPDLPVDFAPLKTHGPVGPSTGGGSASDRYRVKGNLGSGGMAEVYLARDVELGRDVALKVLRGQYATDAQFVERFRREARSAASLSHANIVTIFDRGTLDDGSYYITMEYVPGGTLKDHISMRGALSPQEAVSLTLQVARALRAAHQRGMVHRDIKPQNILLTEEGYAKVADFGIARAASLSTMTRTGAIMGTAHYLSPEQALGEPAGPQSDIYSLGIVLYEMLTGELPHDAETPVAIVMKHVSGELRPPKEIKPELPGVVNAVTVRMLARNIEERYADADALIEDLERAQKGGKLPLPPTAASVPDLAGKSVSQSSAALAAVSLRLGTRSKAASDTAAKGHVIGQSPAAGARVETGSPVNITVSSGRRGALRKVALLAGGSVVTLLFVAFALLFAVGFVNGFTEGLSEAFGKDRPRAESGTRSEGDSGEVSFTSITDDSGALSVEVPSDWGDVDGKSPKKGEVGPGLSAAPDLEDFNSGDEHAAGVIIGASEKLAQETNVRQLLDANSSLFEACEYVNRESYTNGGLTGEMDFYRDCRGTGNRAIYVAAAPEDGSYLTTIFVRLPGKPTDKEIKDHILDTFEVTGDVGFKDPTDSSYATVTDDTGALTIAAPSGWSEVGGGPWAFKGEDAGPSVALAPDLAGFGEYDYEDPGVFFAASKSLLETQGVDGMLDYYGATPQLECDDRQGREPFDNGTYSGKIEIYENCDGKKARVIQVAAVPENEGHLTWVDIRLPDDAEAEEVETRILDSFEVSGNL